MKTIPCAPELSFVGTVGAVDFFQATFTWSRVQRDLMFPVTLRINSKYTLTVAQMHDSFTVHLRDEKGRQSASEALKRETFEELWCEFVRKLHQNVV